MLHEMKTFHQHLRSKFRAEDFWKGGQVKRSHVICGGRHLSLSRRKGCEYRRGALGEGAHQLHEPLVTPVCLIHFNLHTQSVLPTCLALAWIEFLALENRDRLPFLKERKTMDDNGFDGHMECQKIMYNPQ